MVATQLREAALAGPLPPLRTPGPATWFFNTGGTHGLVQQTRDLAPGKTAHWTMWAFVLGGAVAAIILIVVVYLVWRRVRKPSATSPSPKSEGAQAPTPTNTSLLPFVEDSPTSVPAAHVLCPSLVVPAAQETSFALKENMFSWTPRQPSKIQDARGEVLAKVEGTCIGPADRMALKSPREELLCEVQRRSLDFAEHPNVFDIFHPHGELFGVLEKDMLLPKFTVTSSAGAKLLMFEGDFRKKEITVTSGSGRTVAQTGQGFFKFSRVGHYQVRVASGIDAGLVMVCCLAIDEADF